VRALWSFLTGLGRPRRTLIVGIAACASIFGKDPKRSLGARGRDTLAMLLAAPALRLPKITSMQVRCDVGRG
jgi:hypothetical protein